MTTWGAASGRGWNHIPKGPVVARVDRTVPAEVAPWAAVGVTPVPAAGGAAALVAVPPWPTWPRGSSAGGGPVPGA